MPKNKQAYVAVGYTNLSPLPRPLPVQTRSHLARARAELEHRPKKQAHPQNGVRLFITASASAAGFKTCLVHEFSRVSKGKIKANANVFAGALSGIGIDARKNHGVILARLFKAFGSNLQAILLRSVG